MNNRIAYWSNGKHSKNVFTVKLWKFRLELWKDFTPNQVDNIEKTEE